MVSAGNLWRSWCAILHVIFPHCLTPRMLLCSLIDFNFSRPSGSDLGRYRNVLFNAKGRNQPMAAQ